MNKLQNLIKIVKNKYLELYRKHSELVKTFNRFYIIFYYENLVNIGTWEQAHTLIESYLTSRAQVLKMNNVYSRTITFKMWST